MPALKKVLIDETTEELMEMHQDEATYGLNEKQKAFCEYYVRSYNMKIAAIKAGYKPTGAACAAGSLRKQKKVNRYIAWLKIRMTQETLVTPLDIIDKHVRIAFSDITDFCEINGNKIKLVNSEKMDGQLVKSVKKGRDGSIHLELYDKLQSLKVLENYFDVIPDDWKRKIEERKLQLMEQRLELDKSKYGFGGEVKEDDGFLQALAESAEEVWEDDNNA